MALDNGYNVNKQLPQYPDGNSLTDNRQAEEWSMDKVIEWLEAHGWGSVAPLFELNEIQGQAFLDLTMTKLAKVIPRSDLAYGDKRRLLHGIHSIQGTHGQQQLQEQQQQQQGSTFMNEDSGLPPHYLDTAPKDQLDTKQYSTSPVSTLSTPQTTTSSHQPSSTQVPLLSYPDGTSTTSSYSSSGSLSSPSAITPSTTAPSTMESEYAKIRPYIPERKSSNPIQISKIMKQFNVPPTLPLARTRPNPIISRRPNGNHPLHPSFRINKQQYSVPVPPPPISPRQANSEMDGGWKISRRPGAVAMPKQEPREQRIQVTLDSDTFFSLTVTNMHDPMVLKSAIVNKLGMNVMYLDHYQFYHENGENSGIPLEDDELLYICGHSDNSKHRILLKSTAPVVVTTESPSSSPSSAQPQHIQYHQQPVSLWAVPPRQQENPKPTPTASLWAVPPRQQDFPQIESTPSASLWAVPPRPIPATEERQPSVSLWAVPPRPIQSNEQPSASLWAVPPRPIQSNEQPVTPHLAIPPTRSTQDTNSPVASSSTSSPGSLWAVPPRPFKDTNATTPAPSPSASLWAVPPKQLQHQQPSPVPSPSSSTASLGAAPPKSTPDQDNTLASGLWAIPPRLSPSSSSSTKEQTDTVTPPSSGIPSLWAVPPQSNIESMEGLTLEDPPVNLSPPTASTSSPSSSSTASSPSLRPSLVSSKSSTPRLQKRLQIQIPPTQQKVGSPSSSPATTTMRQSSPSVPPSTRTTPHSETGSPISSSQDLTDSEEENWAERPSIDQLYKDIDRYLPGHDLDKEIMLEGGGGDRSTANNNQQPPPPETEQAPLPVVATAPLTRRLQGHKKSIRVVAKEAHRNWRQAVNVIRVNNILRRRSTKMWGHKVQQVKPGMALTNEATPTTLHDGKPAPTKLQWMRGQLIGKGSYGRVYHALNVAAGEWIAVKQVDIPTTSSDRHNKQLHDTADALYREIQLLKDLEHDNIVQYLGYDVDEDEGHINIFLEYVPGGSIASCLSKQGKFDESLVSYFTRQILLGLEYLHDRNILHRDIKAGNVLLTHTGTCKITDFGLSKLSGQDKAYDAHGNNSVMRGTVFWMAPEVVSGTNYNAKVDIWSLGCTVIEMLTGKHPWLDMNMLAALYSLGRFEAPPIPEEIHDNAKSFLKLCFTINPEDRPTAADLLVHPFVQQNPSFKFKEHTKI